MAIHPLRVEELVEVLAVDFDDAEEVPKLKPGWHREDQERAFLTSCFSLIAVVDTGLSRVVKFSHFSVGEYLASARLATSSQDVSRYHIVLEPAHTTMAQVCLSVLLPLDDHNEQNDVGENAPLAGCTAECWVNHAQFEDVVPRIKGWNIFLDWTNHILLLGVSCMTWMPILLRKQSFTKNHGAVGYQVSRACKWFWQLLHRNGSSVDPRGDLNKATLHSAACCGDFEMVQRLLDYGIDVNAQNDFALICHLNDPRVV